MSERSAILSLPYIQPAQAQKHVTHNEALRHLDLVVQLGVTDRDRGTPPADPAEGARHIVGAGASGAWAGREGQIALWSTAEGWLFTPPLTGWRAWVAAEEDLIVFDGTGWKGLHEVLGINTVADEVNRLAVASEASLFSHDGAGHQVKVNKEAAGDTASLLFQTGWSGRAEMGTTGSDAFALKVSADGVTWRTALEADPATGLVSGEAVQQSATDTTAGRLMRADYGYGPGNVTGPVSQSGGVPTGAVMESGSTANGSYVRFADGTQLCRFELPASYLDGARIGATWTFPAVFAGTPVVSAVIDSRTLPITPGADGLGALFVTLLGGSAATVRLFRTAGAANFNSGDSAVLQVTATGRWF